MTSIYTADSRFASIAAAKYTTAIKQQQHDPYIRRFHYNPRYSGVDQGPPSLGFRVSAVRSIDIEGGEEGYNGHKDHGIGAVIYDICKATCILASDKIGY